MNQIHFEPNDGYLIIARINVPFPIPSKYKDIIYEKGKADHFTGSLIRKNEEWYIYIDKLKFLPQDDILKVIDGLKISYKKVMPNVNVDEFIKIEGKLLRRKIVEKTENFFNNIINLPGTIVYSLVMLGEKDTLYAIKFPEKFLSDVSSILMDFILDSPLRVDVLLLNKENYFPEPSFIKLIKSFKLDYSKYTLIKTEWKMTEEELRNENRGIFQNEMSFKPKYFGMEAEGLVGRMVAELKSEDIKGNVNKAIIEGNGKNAQLVEFDLKSKWFHDIYNDVLYPMGGSFFYWGYSDGRGTLENYYIIPARNQMEFLKGLKKHWSEPSRVKHINTISYVNNLGEVMKEYNFL